VRWRACAFGYRPTAWSSLLPVGTRSGNLAIDFVSFYVLPASYRVMSTVAGTSDGAGADETTIFSPEQLALIDHLITNRVATASGESASTSATPGVPPSSATSSAAFGKCPVRPGSGHPRP
jgi:hypothetical protein